MKTVAFDLATRKIGWSVFDDKVLEDSGCVEFKQPDVNIRIRSIREWLSSVLPKDDLAQCILEKPWAITGRSSKTASVLWQVFGGAKFLALERGYEVVEVAPQTWRKTCGIKLRKRVDVKRAARAFVSQMFGKEVREDEAEAICIGWWGVNQ